MHTQSSVWLAGLGSLARLFKTCPEVGRSMNIGRTPTGPRDPGNTSAPKLVPIRKLKKYIGQLLLGCPIHVQKSAVFRTLVEHPPARGPPETQVLPNLSRLGNEKVHWSTPTWLSNLCPEVDRFMNIGRTPTGPRAPGNTSAPKLVPIRKWKKYIGSLLPGCPIQAHDMQLFFQ